MRLINLYLHDFRNYHRAKIRFSKGINVLIGNNAQGKTNLLESIYVLALTKSDRTRNNRNLIRWGHSAAQIRGTIQKSLGDVRLELDLARHHKRAKVNQLSQARLSSYVGRLNVILFTPNDLSIVKGAPRIRRRFINTEFSQISNRYLYDATRYERVLKQRNQYLKDLNSHQASDLAYLEVLSDQLSAYGARIIWQRLVLLKRLSKWAQKIHAVISLRTETLQLKYLTALDRDHLASVNQIYVGLKQRYLQIQDREIERRTTLIGPHRDDLRFIVNGHDVQTFGSQGQQRTSALSVKLAEIDLMKAETGERPLLLLDDVLSELDNQRQTHLLEAIQDKVQTFLTTTDFNGIARDLIRHPKVFKISHGQIKVVDNG